MPLSTPRRVHRTDIQMRFADTDALGHVNNGSFVVYAETARLQLLQVLGAAARSLILAHVGVDFRRQVHVGQAVAVETWVAQVGRSSATLDQRILADGALAAEVRSVVVCFDYAAQRSVPWSDASRAALHDWMAEGAA